MNPMPQQACAGLNTDEEELGGEDSIHNSTPASVLYWVARDTALMDKSVSKRDHEEGQKQMRRWHLYQKSRQGVLTLRA